MGRRLATVSARIDLNGFYLIQDTRQSRDGKESFATHGVFTYDRDDRLYKFSGTTRSVTIRHRRRPAAGPANR